MSITNGNSENKMIFYSPDSIVMPITAGVTIYQGDRVKISSNAILSTAACTEDWLGVADFQTPVASLGDALTAGKVLLKDNVVWFDAPASESFAFGATVYAYTAAGYYYPQGVTISSGNSAKIVGVYVGLTTVTGGAGVRVAVKIAPTTVI